MIEELREVKYPRLEKKINEIIQWINEHDSVKNQPQIYIGDQLPKGSTAECEQRGYINK